MFKYLLTPILLSTLLLAENAQDFATQQMQEFAGYKKSQEDAFNDYVKEQEKAFEDYKKEVGVFWEEPKLTTNKEWVAYTPDKKTRTEVDFEKEEIVVETIADDPQEAQQKLQIALAKAVTINTKEALKEDVIEQKIAKIEKPEGIVDAKVKAQPILSDVVFKTSPTKEDVKEYVNQHIDTKNMIALPSTKVPHAKIYQVKVQLPKDTMIQKSKTYYEDVKLHAAKQKLPLPLVFAIMHSESSFNPMARSHIPAYGLMQIVPKTAGVDTYNFLYGEKKLVSGSYLYNPQNNITMGSAYLHILYYRYLKKIENPDSRLYCTIAAYNTGAGNIAWAFTKKYNMNNAAPIINKLTPEEVYNRLLKDLRFDEPKHYLKKVSQRMAAYHKVYGN